MVEPENRAPKIRRAKAAQATLDKFKDRPFAWGVRDCARLVAFHLRLCGYQVKLPPSGSYRTLLGARKALAKAGYGSIPEALDAFELDRITPAGAVAGDIIQWPSENDLAALGVALGNGRIVAYHPDAIGATILQPIETIAAWRVHPK